MIVLSSKTALLNSVIGSLLLVDKIAVNGLGIDVEESPDSCFWFAHTVK